MNLESTLVTLYASLPFGASFLAGILTFLSPCLLPLIPPYISYISGVSIDELHQKATHKSRVILTSLLFICGFSLTFIILAIFAESLLGVVLGSSFVRYVAGGIIILFGIHFLFPLKFGFLYKNAHLQLKHSAFGFLAPFVLGVGFSIGWSPCVGPILASILTLSAFNQNSALWLMLCYCLGLGLAFLLVAIFISNALKLLKKLTSFLRVIEVVSGLLLILIGVLIMAEKSDFYLL